MDQAKAENLHAEFVRALRLHRHGGLEHAERIYRSILTAEPRQFDAANALGALLLQQGRFELACRQISMAIQINPNDATAYANYGLALQQLGRAEDALASCNNAIALDPNLADAFCNRGLALRELERLDDALESFDRAIALRPDFADAFSNRGVVLKESGRLEAALESFGGAIALRPDFAAALNNRGLVLSDLARFDEALSSFDRAIALIPNYAEAHGNRGLALGELKRFAEALDSFDRAIAIGGEIAKLCHNRALALRSLERIDEALASCDRAIALDPAMPAAFFNRGLKLAGLDRLDESLASLDNAIALDPDYAEARNTRALTRLSLGQFSEGWNDAEYRWNTRQFRMESTRPNLDVKALGLWVKREELVGKRLLVVAEQGVGDEIMFASMIPDLMRDAGSVAVECDPRLAGLFTRSFPGVEIIRRTTHPLWHPRDFDRLIPIASLGRLYRNCLEDFPSRSRHLVPSTEIGVKWRTRLSSLGAALNVGISWKGGTEGTRRKERSIPLSLLRPLFEVDGVNFISLQYGDVKAEIEQAALSLPRPIARFDPSEIDDFDQLAGLISTLDLVISVQTTLVHLCGAIGHPCWVMVPCAPEWRYGARGRSMPWYSSVTLHRQEKRGEWRDLIADVAASLAELAKPGQCPPATAGRSPDDKLTHR